MFFLALAVQIIIAIIIPLKIIGWQYQKNGKLNERLILVFGIINFIISIRFFLLYYPRIDYPSNSNGGIIWLLVDIIRLLVDAAPFVAAFAFPIIADKIAENKYSTFDLFKFTSLMSFDEKERILMQVSDGVKKCCEELRGFPDDLRIFLNRQMNDGTVTELEATILFERYSLRF